MTDPVFRSDASISDMAFSSPCRVDVTLRLVEDSVHVYTIFPFLPETRSTMDEVTQWGQRILRRNDPHPQAAE